MSLSLNCFVFGDEPDRTFTIEVPKTKNVSILKDLIKEKKPSRLSDIDASDLDLFHVSFPIDNLEMELKSLNLAVLPKLSPPSKKLATFFKDVVDNCLHVIAKAPTIQPSTTLNSSQLLSLNCWVFGDDPRRTFTVKIQETENVSILKKLIKEEKAPHLNHVAASDLDLFHVSFLIDNLAMKLENLKFADLPKLSPPSKKLATFSKDVVDDCLHVIARAPEEIHPAAVLDSSQLLSLNCLVFGDEPDRTFTVEVPKTKNVSILKDLIKEKKAPHLDHVAASDLDLWKVSERFLLRDLGQKDVNIDDYLKLPPGEKLASTFQDISDDCLHVLAKASTWDEQGETDMVPELREFKRYNKTLSAKGLSPSEGAKSTGYRKTQASEATAIYDGRRTRGGISTTSPPIEIFHPVFDQFIHIVNDPNVQPTTDDLKNVQDLMYYLSQLFPSEDDYAPGLRQRLHKILQVDVLPTSNPDGSRPDGTVTLLIGDARIVYLVLELKREVGDGGSDPAHQGGLSSKHSWIDPSSEPIREKCCCPTFLVAGAGPWITVLGEVFTDRFIVQRLTDMRWMSLSSTEEDSRVYHNARVFIALRKCLAELKRYYQGLAGIPRLVANQSHPRYFPYPDSFTTGDGSVTCFRYLRSLEDDNTCVTYLAELIGDSKKVVVKFAARYGKVVHNFLAQHEHAPKLLYCGPIPGNRLSGILNEPARRAPPSLCLRSDVMHMVVMEYVDARSDKPQDRGRGQIEKILWLLHVNGYVFGDLREPNVLYDPDGTVQMIDFNWCGRYDMNVTDEHLPPGLQEEIDERKDDIKNKDKVAGNMSYVCYPLSMSMVEDMWAPGMEPLAPIRPQHDWKMLDKLFPKVTNSA